MFSSAQFRCAIGNHFQVNLSHQTPIIYRSALQSGNSPNSHHPASPGNPSSQAESPTPSAASSATNALSALCAVARFHQVAADPATLAHQLGLSSSDPLTTSDLLRAAQHLGLKAKLSHSSIERLGLLPLPALALMRQTADAGNDTDTGSGNDTAPRIVILAQSDGQRVLLLDFLGSEPKFSQPKADPSGAMHGIAEKLVSDPNKSRPTIEPVDVFASQWTGQLILITSRASLAGSLAKFDFSWFIPALVKYRKLLGEVLLISFMLQLFGLVSPLFFQVVMDKVLVHKGMTTLDVLVIGLVIVVVFESVLNALRAYVFSHTTSRIDVELGARLFRHLVQLPLAYFQARRVGDSVARVRELENIRSFLTGNALTVLLDVFFSIVFIAVMLFYSVRLLGSDTNFSATHCVAPAGSAFG